MSKHALLSASSSHRWLSCPPLLRLESYFENKESEAAVEGTQAHELAESKLRLVLGHDSKKIITTDKEMDEYTNDYVAYILEQIEQVKQTTKDPIVLIEQRLDFLIRNFDCGKCGTFRVTDSRKIKNHFTAIKRKGGKVI